MQESEKKRISKIYEIVQLDFDHDNLLFIDPYRINEHNSDLAKRAKSKIIRYFDIFFKCIEEGDRNKVLYMGKNLHEINATKLGYTSSGSVPKGKGFSQKDLVQIYDAAKEVEDYIEDMPDVLILAENVGPDKISDITTNIIYEELIEFTLKIIKRYGLDIELVNKRKYVYDVYLEKWIKKSIEVPTMDEKEILFLPKSIVSSYQVFSYITVYKKLVYPYYKTNTAIHHLIRGLKNNIEKPDCKKIKKKYPLRRDTVKKFKVNFSYEYKNYKDEMKRYYWMQ